MDDSYNVQMAATDPKSPLRNSKAPILRLESIGLLLIAVAALAFIVIRYGHHIAWSAR